MTQYKKTKYKNEGTEDIILDSNQGWAWAEVLSPGFVNMQNPDQHNLTTRFIIWVILSPEPLFNHH